MDFTLCQNRREAILAIQSLREEGEPSIIQFRGGETIHQNDIRFVDFLLGNGQILIGKDRKNFVGFCGYVFQEPQVAYIYIADISREQRVSHVFLQGLLALVQELSKENIKTMKFKARVENAYNNRLYSKFAKPIKQELNEKGELCILYGADIESLSETLAKYQH